MLNYEKISYSHNKEILDPFEYCRFWANLVLLTCKWIKPPKENKKQILKKNRAFRMFDFALMLFQWLTFFKIIVYIAQNTKDLEDEESKILQCKYKNWVNLECFIKSTDHQLVLPNTNHYVICNFKAKKKKFSNTRGMVWCGMSIPLVTLRWYGMMWYIFTAGNLTMVSKFCFYFWITKSSGFPEFARTFSPIWGRQGHWV